MTRFRTTWWVLVLSGVSLAVLCCAWLPSTSASLDSRLRELGGDANDVCLAPPRWLANLDRDTRTAELAARLRHSDPQVRVGALRALAVTEAWDDRVYDALDDPYEAVASEAQWVFCPLGRPNVHACRRAVERALVGDGSVSARRIAFQNARKLQPCPADIERRLVETLFDVREPTSIRSDVAGGLAGASDATLARLARCARDDGHGDDALRCLYALVVARRIPDAAVLDVAETLRDVRTRRHVRALAAHVVLESRRTDRELQAALRDALLESGWSENERRHLAEALSATGLDPDLHTSELLALRNDPDPNIQTWVGRAIARR